MEQPIKEPEKNSILREVFEFAIAVAWLGIAFGIAIAGGLSGGAFSDIVALRTIIVESLVVVFFAFVFHEMAHRIVARRYGFRAVFHVWIPGLLVALGASLIGFLFAAPGGVHVEMGKDSHENRIKMGKIALAGPVTNIVLSILFIVFVIAFVYIAEYYIASTGRPPEEVEPFVETAVKVGIIGLQVNAWLAIFNLLPIGNFDGYKIRRWNQKVWMIALIIAVLLYVLIYLVQYFL